MEPGKTKELTQRMKDNGKTIFLEVVSCIEAEYIRGAKPTVECGSDYLVGTIFYDSVFEYIKTADLKYYPFVGTVTRNPSTLQEIIQEVLDQEAMFAEKGYMETGLLGYRHVDGDPVVLSVEYVAEAKKPAIPAGSIGSGERVAGALKINLWTFIMGSALFAEEFTGDGSLRQNLEYVLGLLK